MSDSGMDKCPTENEGNVSDHKHEWTPAGQIEREKVMSSPVSRWSDYLWTDVLLVQSCTCGKVRHVKIGEKDGRSRRDDLRAGKA